MNETTSDSVRNVLFIMCDQLRLDALSCFGGSVIETPNIDRLAARGVRFDQAHVQGSVCGSSRMSFYTGRCPVSWRPLQPDSAVDRATHAWRSPRARASERC